MTRRRAAEAWGLVLPFALWGLSFVLLYAGHGLACGTGVEPGGGAGLTRGILAALLLLFLVAHAGLALHYLRRWRTRAPASIRFVRLVALVLAIAALAATFWTGLPVLMLRVCS